MRFVPFAGEALGFGALGGRHLLRNVVAIFDGLLAVFKGVSRRGGLAVGNPHRWGDTFDGLTVLLDEIEEKGVKAVLVEADDRGAGGVEGDALRNILKILEARNVFPR